MWLFGFNFTHTVPDRPLWANKHDCVSDTEMWLQKQVCMTVLCVQLFLWGVWTSSCECNPTECVNLHQQSQTSELIHVRFLSPASLKPDKELQWSNNYQLFIPAEPTSSSSNARCAQALTQACARQPASYIIFASWDCRKFCHVRSLASMHKIQFNHSLMLHKLTQTRSSTTWCSVEMKFRPALWLNWAKWTLLECRERCAYWWHVYLHTKVEHESLERSSRVGFRQQGKDKHILSRLPLVIYLKFTGTCITMTPHFCVLWGRFIYLLLRWREGTVWLFLCI